MVAYCFEDSRLGEFAVGQLSGYRVILQVDGHAAYNNMLARLDSGNDGITLAADHTGDASSTSCMLQGAVARATVKRMAELAVEMSDGGGRTWATIATLLPTTKMNTSIGSPDSP